MTYFSLLLSLFAVDLFAAITPGPNFVVVSQTAIRESPGHAAAVVTGILTANFLWCLGVLLGLSALFDLAPWLYTAMKLLGGGYLIYLGVSLWRTRGVSRPTFASPHPWLFPAAYVRGLLTSLSNPKSVLYFGSIFALFMGPETPLWVKVLAIGIVLFDTVLWYGTVAAMFSRVQVQRAYAALERPINRITGAVMIGFGTRMILVRD
jgi:threonine efflux protein